MEQEGATTSDSGGDDGEGRSCVLYVAPLRIVAPPGVQPPPACTHRHEEDDDDDTTNPLNPLSGLPPHFLRFRHHTMVGADQNMKPRRPKSSAVRDYPDGCGRRPKPPQPEQIPSEPEQTLDNLQTARKHRHIPEKPVEISGKNEQNAWKKEQASAKLERTSGKFEQNSGKPELSETLHAEAEFPIAASPPSSRKKKREAPAGSNVKASKRPSITRKTTTVGLSPAAARKIITETLRVFDAVRRNLLLETEPKGSRPDLNAGGVLTSHGLSLNRSAKRVGSLPGVEVGDIFYFRMELSCIGMHGPIQAGIDYLNSKETKWDTPVAISIISSGGYDAKDDGDELIYTGQGGKSTLDKPTEDQKLERGNLAMEGSMKHQVPVRVIRGVKDTMSPSGKTYTYDGLYKVEKFWSEKGKSGFEEFKFKLQRLPDQPELGSAVIKLSNQLKYKPNTRKGVQIADFSGGEEAVPICVVNTVDDEISPTLFKYSTTVRYPGGHSQQFGQPDGCDCKNVCTSSKACSCLVRNENVFAYANNGSLVKERGVIYECGGNCKCSLSCGNRVTQRSLKHHLEIFKTEDRGWGLRCQDIIPAGSFVCEYTGRLVHDLHSLQNRDYLLNLSMVPSSNPRWGDVSSLLNKQESAQAGNDLPRPEFMIDSSKTGNVARFINHSCSPNLLVQCVLRDHQDTRCPHAMLFAMDNIPPFRELTIDYGSGLSSSELQVQGKVCACKSVDCRGRFGH